MKIEVNFVKPIKSKRKFERGRASRSKSEITTTTQQDQLILFTKNLFDSFRWGRPGEQFKNPLPLKLLVGLKTGARGIRTIYGQTSTHAQKVIHQMREAGLVKIVGDSSGAKLLAKGDYFLHQWIEECMPNKRA